MSAQRIARRKISAEKQAAAANTDFTNLNNNFGEEFTQKDYDSKMMSKDVKTCMDRMDGNLSPASIRRRTSRSKSVQNSEKVSRDLSMRLPGRQVRSVSDGHVSVDSVQRRMTLSSVASDETFDESEEGGCCSSSDRSQLEDLISPRSWSDMIASDIATTDSGDNVEDHSNNNNSNNNNNNIGSGARIVDRRVRRNGVLKKVYVEDVTFHDINANQPIGSLESKDGLITPRTWTKMVGEDCVSRDQTQDNEGCSSEQFARQNSSESSPSKDLLAASLKFAWPNELLSNTSPSRDHGVQNEDQGNTSRDAVQSCDLSPGSRQARLERNIRMLKTDLMAMRQMDQHLLRQLLTNYETIGEVADHVTVTMETPSPLPPSLSSSPYLTTPRSTPSSPEKRRSISTTPGDTELLRIIREALAQPGSLDIRNIVTELSPIRRRRSSEPPAMEYDDLPSGFGEDDDDDQELEDLLSLSCPVFQEPKGPRPARNRTRQETVL